VSVDANPSTSPERPTSAAASTSVVGDTQQQQCASAVTVNDHDPCDPQQSASATAAVTDSPSDSQAVTCNKTESVVAAAAATSSPRPICPNLPYSPACSPRFARRRPPLRECRVSVNVQSLDDPNVHQKLNQYKLIDSIGQVYILYTHISNIYCSERFYIHFYSLVITHCHHSSVILS